MLFSPTPICWLRNSWRISFSKRLCAWAELWKKLPGFCVALPLGCSAGSRWSYIARCLLPRYSLRAAQDRILSMDNAVNGPSMEYAFVLKGTLSRAINCILYVLNDAVAWLHVPLLSDCGYLSSTCMMDGRATRNRSVKDLLRHPNSYRKGS